ncbi:MAG TPA: glycerophosphodiester phosphodiesterase [Acidimicrobiales bacterium]|nr:glycerophosphodiester phosphodiesterase [Acidimicrobiales bacterium]
MRIVAHRTCPLDAPENSLAGIRLAGQVGADAVEIDVRVDASKVVVLGHDRTYWRVARSPLPVRFTPSSVRRRLHLKDGRPPPALSDAIAALPAGLGLVVETKDRRAVRPSIELLAGRGVLARTALWVRSPSDVEMCADFAPMCERALLEDPRDAASAAGYLARAIECGATAVSLHQDLVDSDIVGAAHDAAVTVYCWAVRLDGHTRAIEAGCDGLVTDWPAQAPRVAGA